MGIDRVTEQVAKVSKHNILLICVALKCNMNSCCKFIICRLIPGGNNISAGFYHKNNRECRGAFRRDIL